MLATAWIGLGGNQGNVPETLKKGVRCLLDHVEISLKSKSGLYKTAPIGYLDQDDFVNAVISIQTSLKAPELLKLMLSVESDLFRVRSENQFGPRSIDLDLLLFDELIQQSDFLTLPHPRMHERRFVLEPLHSLEPDLLIPGKGKVKDLLKTVQQQTIEPMDIPFIVN